jgi:hypothetical protein
MAMSYSNDTCSLSCDFHEMVHDLGPGPAAIVTITIAGWLLLLLTLLGISILNVALPRRQVVLRITDFPALDGEQSCSKAFQYRALRALLRRPLLAYDLRMVICRCLRMMRICRRLTI